MAIPSVTRSLSQAGIQIIETLAARAQDREDTSGDPLYTGIDNWCQAVLHSGQMEAAFDQAQDELSTFHIDSQTWLEDLGAVFENGGETANGLAINIWLFYVFNIDKTSEEIWEQYPRILRNTVFSSNRNLPQSWGLWTAFVHDFMTLFTQVFEGMVEAFPRLFTEEAIKMLESLYIHEREGFVQADRLPNESLNYRVAFSAYLTHVMDTVGYFSLGSYPSSMNSMVPITEVYVPLNFVSLTDEDQERRQIRYTTASYDDPAIHMLRSPLDPGIFEGAESLELADVLEMNNRILILGENGAGKSVLSRYLAFQDARLLHDDINAGNVKIEETPDGSAAIELPGPLPVHIDLGEYLENAFAEESIEAYFLRILGEAIRETDVVTLLEAFLDKGDCQIMLDGFDQAVTDEKRRQLLIEITNATDRWAARGNQVIVTSRLEGYEAAPLPDNFTGFVLCSPSRHQVNTMVLKWRMTLAKFKDPYISEDEAIRQAQGDTLSLINKIGWDPRLFKLVRSPMLLRMLVEVYKATSSFVPRRAAIYESVAESMLYRWHLPHLPIDHPTILHQEIVDILSALAFWMLGSRASGMISEKELKLIIGNAWSDLHPDLTESDVLIAVNELLDVIQHYSGVLVKVDRNRYQFAFKGLLEYFAALYLISSYRHTAEKIRMRLHDPNWNSIIRLALGLLGMRSRDDASDMIDISILGRGELAHRLGHENSPFEDLLHRDLFFAARLLCDDVEVRPDIVNHVLDSLIDLWRRGEGNSTGRFTLVFDAARRHLINLDQTSYSYRAMQHTLGLLDRGTERQRAYTVDALTFWKSQHGELNSLAPELSNSESPLIKYAAANGFCFVDELSLETYLMLLNFAVDDDRRIKHAALEAIKLSSPIPHEALRVWDEFLSKNDARQRISLHMLSELGSLPPKIITRLLGLINDPDPEIQIKAIKVLGRNANLPENALFSLYDLTDHPNDDVRSAATGALAREVVLPDEILNRLQDLVHDNNRAVRSKAIKALSACENTDNSIFNTLIEQLNAPSESQRESVIEPLILKDSEDPRIPSMLRHAAGQALSIRRTVAHALRLFPEPDPEIGRIILNLLKDPDETVRRTMLTSIRSMEHPGEEIVAYLVNQVKNRSLSLAEEIIRTLASISPLDEDELLTLVDALPRYWERCGRAIKDALLAHQPLTPLILSRMKRLAFAEVPQNTRIPTTLRTIAVETLSGALSDPLILKNTLKLAISPRVDMRLRIAAIRSIAFCNEMKEGVKRTLLTLIGDTDDAIRIEAGKALAKLITSLPDHHFEIEELFDAAKRLALMLEEVPICASWEEESNTQNDVFLALHRIVARIRPEPPQLTTSLEDTGSNFNQ